MDIPALSLVGIWTLILGVGLFLYVLLDGFDLGVGILYGFAPSPQSRQAMMATVAPVWDGNETWLILGAVGLMSVFPLAFVIIVPALYLPFTVMLLGLAFRGVAFEYRFKEPQHRAFWDRGFFLGSAIATFAQGTVIGAFIQGFAVRDRVFIGSSWDWLTPFSFMTGLGLMAGYALLGAGWLVLKTEGDLQNWARRQGIRGLVGALAALLVVSLWTPLTSPAIAERWFSWPNIAFLAPVPLLTLVAAGWVWRSLRLGGEMAPFVASLCLVLLSYLGIAISLWPVIVPPRYSLWDAAASPNSQAFLLVGTLFLLPVILFYTGWSYWVFRGKVRGDTGYH